MFNPSKKTAAALAVFMTASSSIMFAGCSPADDSLDSMYDDQVLKDDNGNEYTLKNNGDGTETATYKNGEQVTFRRDSDGNMNYVAGAAGLIGGLAAGYYMFHGLNRPSGSYYDNSSKKYVTPTRPTKMKEEEREKKAQAFIPNGHMLNGISSSRSGGGSKSNVSNSKGSSNSTASSPKSTGSSAKGGFGSAGARGGAS